MSWAEASHLPNSAHRTKKAAKSQDTASGRESCSETRADAVEAAK